METTQTLPTDPRIRIQQLEATTRPGAKPKAPRFAYVILGEGHWVSPYKYHSHQSAFDAGIAEFATHTEEA